MSAIDCRRPCQFVSEPPPPDGPADGNTLYLPPSTPPAVVERASVDGANCLLPFSDLLTRQHSLCPEAATAISLAVLSATIGPGRTLKNPLSGSVSAAFNVIVEDAAHAAAQRAAHQALQPFQKWVTKKITAHQERGTKHLRQARMELEIDCARAVDHLRFPPEKAREPLTIPLPAHERKREAVAAAREEAKQVTARWDYFEFEARPFITVDGLGARDVPALPQRSFDGAVLNFSPHGDALHGLEIMRQTDRREVLRYLVAAWHHQPYLSAACSILTPCVTNLWLAAPGDTARLWRVPAIAASGLPETFLLVTNDAEPETDAEAHVDSEVVEDWHNLIEVVLDERIRGETAQYELSEQAAERFLDFRKDLLRQQHADTRRFTAWWPEHLLKITLLLHLSSLRAEVAGQIDLTTMEAAIGLMERLGAAQLRTLVATTARAEDFETQIELMVARVRVKGPMPKWTLFKGFHSHPAAVMEPLLARCCERNLLRVDNDLVQLAETAE